MRSQDALYRLLETTIVLNSTQNERLILEEILKAIRYVMNAEASSLLLLDHASNELYFDAIEGGLASVREIRLKLGEGIAGWVAQNAKSLMINDVRRDPRFTGRADKSTGFITKNMICAPLMSEGKVTGVIQAINKINGRFNATDEKIFMAFAAQAAISLNNARLYSMAFIDSLTGAYGRRYFETWIEKELARSKRYGGDFCLAIADIDYFKRINDQFGHQTGDRVLSETARAIKTLLRTSDILARYGGEEFALILPQTDLDNGFMLCDRLRHFVSEQDIAHNNQNIAVTVSLGIASFRESQPQTIEDFIRSSDEALYQAKNSGRNKVARWQPRQDKEPQSS